VTTDEKIALRNSWLKIGVIGSVIAVLVVKIWQADFTQAFSGFDFSDLLSLFLAIFSISLAVLFYLKATDTSNVFYDNTYRFTKDVSEILGRVEAGFGERLRHLDEGYTGLKSAVEKLPFDRAKAEEEIKEEEEQLQKVEQERAELFESLAKRAQLQEEEKSSLFARLKEQDEELASARRELHYLRRRLHEAEAVDENLLVRRIPPHIRHMLDNAILPNLRDEISHGAPMRIVNRRFNALREELPSRFFEELKEFGIVDSDGDLTPIGFEILKSNNRERP
jgi:DNA-binding transcriptional regulator GbsR (MarR family)